MASRYFFALYAVAMFAAVASIGVEKAQTNKLFFLDHKEKLDDSQLQTISELTIVDEIVEGLRNVCSIAKNCLKDIITECKRHWFIPHRLLQCVKEFIKDSEDKCLNLEFARFY